MFKSDFVDFFSRTHPAVVPTLFVPAVGTLLWLSIHSARVESLTTFGLFGGGILAWTLAEYWLHRLFFHWIPSGPWGQRMHFLVHGVHHKWPKDKYRLVMPPAVSVTLFALFLGLFSALLGPRLALGFHAGFTCGYLIYDMTHYYLHHVAPRTRVGRWLKRHHMIHHFGGSESRFGVSSPVWDYVFDTVGRPAPPRHPTRNCESQS